MRDRVLAEVQTAAELGYCVEAGDFLFNGIAGVAVALRDAHGEPTAALSVSVASQNLSQEQAANVAERLMISASELEMTIESQPPAAASRQG